MTVIFIRLIYDGLGTYRCFNGNAYTCTTKRYNNNNNRTIMRYRDFDRKDDKLFRNYFHGKFPLKINKNLLKGEKCNARAANDTIRRITINFLKWRWWRSFVLNLCFIR